MTKVVVNKVIFEGNKAVGLMVEQPVGSEPIKIRAHKEVILSAGSIGSPQLLMLSGIGNQQHLKDMGIKVMQHLPGNFKQFFMHWYILHPNPRVHFGMPL